MSAAVPPWVEVRSFPAAIFVTFQHANTPWVDSLRTFFLSLISNERKARIILILVCLVIIASYLFSSLGMTLLQSKNPSGLKVLAVARRDLNGTRVYDDKQPFKIKQNTVIEISAETGMNLIVKPVGGASAVVSLPATEKPNLVLAALAETTSHARLRSFPASTAPGGSFLEDGRIVVLLARKGGWFLVAPHNNEKEKGVAGWVAGHLLRPPQLTLTEKTAAFEAPKKAGTATNLPAGDRYTAWAVVNESSGLPLYLVNLNDQKPLWVPGSAAVIGQGKIGPTSASEAK